MEKKIYIKPNMQIVEIQTIAMLAASGNGLNSNGTTGKLVPEDTGNAATAHIGSRQYFDTWSEDDEEYEDF